MASFGTIVKSVLKLLNPCDYPVLNSQLLFKIWLTYILDGSLNSMRALFYQLNQSGIEVDMSTFSKANKTRESQCFQQIYSHLMLKVKQKHSCSGIVLFPVDSTVITLTSKLFWRDGYHQIKLLNGFSVTENLTSETVRHNISIDSIFDLIALEIRVTSLLQLIWQKVTKL